MSFTIFIDKHTSKWAPIAFTAFFTGLGYWVVLLVSGVLFGALLMKGFGLAFVLVLLLGGFGGLGGCVYGYRLGVARRRRYAHLHD